MSSAAGSVAISVSLQLLQKQQLPEVSGPGARSGSPSARPTCCRPYFHVVFTLPTEVADIAFQNKAVVYDLLFHAASETMLTIAADPDTWARGSASPRAPHLGTALAAEPSLMIPGIINSCIFSEHGKLVFRAVPLQS